MKRTWREAVLSLVLLLLLILPACASDSGTGFSHSPVHHLLILHTNDHHGHPLKFSYGSSKGAGGLPARATLVSSVRRENPDVLLLDAGDINTGRSESNLFKAEPDFKGYNDLRYDAAALGNHEFDNPPDVLRRQMSFARFPFLCANLRTRDGSLFARPYMIKNFKGLRVAIFGLTLKETPVLTNPRNVEGLEFIDEIEAARELVPKLRQKADLVIGLTHLGIFSADSGSRRLASEVAGIDVIVDGHSHTMLERPILVPNPSGHKTLIVQAWKWGLVLGRLDLWIQDRGIKKFRYEAIPVNLKEMQRTKEGAMVHAPPDIPEDPVLLQMLEPYAREAESRLSEVIGFAQGPFSNAHSRDQDTPIGRLVADSLQWFASKWGADFAIQNGGSIRSDLPAGPISLKSIYDMLPFENSIYILSLKGEQLMRLFDFIGAISPGNGGYPQFSSEVSVTAEREGRRIERVLVKGNPIDANRTYRIVTNSFLAAGGDGYKILQDASEKWDTAALQQPVLIDYIKARGGCLNPATRGDTPPGP